MKEWFAKAKLLLKGQHDWELDWVFFPIFTSIVIALVFFLLAFFLLALYRQRSHWQRPHRQRFPRLYHRTLLLLVLFCCSYSLREVISFGSYHFPGKTLLNLFFLIVSIGTLFALLAAAPNILAIPPAEQDYQGHTQQEQTHYPEQTQKEQVPPPSFREQPAKEETAIQLSELHQQLAYRVEQLEESQQLSKTGSFETEHDKGTFTGTLELYRLFDWPLELAGKPTDLALFHQRVHPEDAAWVQQQVRQAIQLKQPYAFQYRLLMPEGKVKYVFVQARTITSSENTLCSRGTVIDITERIQAEQALHKVNQELLASNEELQSLSEELSASNEALLESNLHLTALREQLTQLVEQRTQSLEKTLAELQQRNEELDQYVYKVSHDVRAPITSISGLLNLIRMEPVPQVLQPYLDLVQNRINRLDEFIRSVLSQSKNLNIPVAKTSIDFGAIIEQCLEELSYYPGFHQVRILTQLPEKGSFYGDESRLIMLFKNLISNAIKYRNPLVDSYLSLRIETFPDYAVIVSEDNGMGIEEQYRESIFKMFFRASEKSDGSGLGLYIAKQAVEKMGGTIQVTSQVRQGTTFTIQLPNYSPTGIDSAQQEL